MYNYHEKGRTPDLESVLADFITYQASSKGDCYSMQQAFRRTETHISKLVDNMTNAMARKEKEHAEIEIHQESIFNPSSIDQ